MKSLEMVALKDAVTTVNPCRLCAPLGASLAIRGIAQAMPILHGSQGCATYMRRYIVSHFREPMDIASSSFGESATIFGGEANLLAALSNVCDRYRPALVGVATTCLAETIGDDVLGIVKRWRTAYGASAPAVICASTPAYSGSHTEGYEATVLAMIEQLARGDEKNSQVNAFAPLCATPADLRYLRHTIGAFGLTPAIVPDISDTLDGGNWETYERIPEGGTPLATVIATGGALASVSFDVPGALGKSPGKYLRERFGVRNDDVGLPIGIDGTDRLLEVLESVSVNAAPREVVAERGRLVDAMIDAHKILFEKRVAIVGEAALVRGLVTFCLEVGLKPVLCASGSNRGKLKETVGDLIGGECFLLDDTDHSSIAEAAKELKLDVVIGPSKVRSWARPLNVPVVNVGFPIHDRFGAGRIKTFGYEGALQLIDRIANVLLERRQEEAGLGWAYL